METPARTFRYTKTYLTSYSRFNDLNDVQMLAAQAVGVPPVKDGAEADAMKDRLKELVSCEYYLLDNLTHSSPYLTKGAASLLESIGSSFRDSLDSKGLPPYRIIVTSVLRTGEDVRRLRKINSNASSNSTHCLAATFDISWSRYDRLGRDQVPPEDLKRVLGEVLHDLRGRGDCYVKHEAKQACFHVTCRKK
ncbi:MAG: hypothetical protein HUJ94_05960 [Bacteroidales bacterium]|nr:hypothetical protein [Bacteroidales bacterium]